MPMQIKNKSVSPIIYKTKIWNQVYDEFTPFECIKIADH